MASLGKASEKCKQPDKSHVPLMCGLPDDLALLCLAKVPRRFHHVLRCVSRRWRALLSTEEWHSCRKRNDLEESWIYVLCRDYLGENCFYVLDPDPARRMWKRLRAFPPACLRKHGMSFEASGRKLYLLGGCSWNKDFTDDVYCYDPSAEKWKEAATMPTARCFFVSATLDDKIYVTSGLGLSSSAVNAWDIYDSQSNHWISQSYPKVITDAVKSVTLDGKIYAFHRTWIDSHFAFAYDPSSRNWEDVDSEIVSCRRGPTVVLAGTLYMLDETSGTRLMMWQKETEDWVPLGRLAQQLTRPPCQLTAIGRSILVIGQNLSTVVIDVDKAAKVGGMLVTSSFAPNLDSDISVISCKTIAI